MAFQSTQPLARAAWLVSCHSFMHAFILSVTSPAPAVWPGTAGGVGTDETREVASLPWCSFLSPGPGLREPLTRGGGAHLLGSLSWRRVTELPSDTVQGGRRGKQGAPLRTAWGSCTLAGKQLEPCSRGPRGHLLRGSVAAAVPRLPVRSEQPLTRVPKEAGCGPCHIWAADGFKM